MNEPKHTPGPWAIKWANQEDAFLDGSNGEAVFLLRDLSQGVDEDLNEANARLIAAAPDLLSALSRLLEITLDACLADGFELDTYQTEARNQAIAALEKATK